MLLPNWQIGFGIGACLDVKVPIDRSLLHVGKDRNDPANMLAYGFVANGTSWIDDTRWKPFIMEFMIMNRQSKLADIVGATATTSGFASRLHRWQ